MRYGILADIHGNLPALRAAIATVRRAGVDRVLCLGDLVGYGPFPNECVALVAELDMVCVAGNHDLIAVGRLPDDRCGALARDTLRWTRRALGADTTSYLEGLPLAARPHDRILMAHGALGDPRRYVVTPEHAAEELAVLAAEHPAATLLLLGHTHLSMAYRDRGGMLLRRTAGHVSLEGDHRFLLNPGSVGQSRQITARARVLVVDLGDLTATFLSPRYDVRATGRALRRCGLPARSHHQPPSVRGALMARARRLTHAAG